MIYFNILNSLGLVHWVEPIDRLRHGVVYVGSWCYIAPNNLFSHRYIRGIRNIGGRQKITPHRHFLWRVVVFIWWYLNYYWGEKNLKLTVKKNMITHLWKWKTLKNLHFHVWCVFFGIEEREEYGPVFLVCIVTSDEFTKRLVIKRKSTMHTKNTGWRVWEWLVYLMRARPA